MKSSAAATVKEVCMTSPPRLAPAIRASRKRTSFLLRESMVIGDVVKVSLNADGRVDVCNTI